MARSKLTPKQERFVAEYLIDLNATRAAERAGYKGRNLDKIGSQLLGKTRVAEAIQAALAARSQRTEVTQDYVLTRLKENVERSMQARPVLDAEGNETGEYRYDGAVANGALKLLGLHLGMFAQKHEHTGKDGGPIRTRVTFIDVRNAELNPEP